MKVAIPREVKNHEYRVAITPSGVHELVKNGHEVYVEKDAGVGSSILNEDYVAAGARILDTADDVWGTGELILKVKEPIASEYDRMREGQTLFTYLHLAADEALTQELVKRKVTGIAYETVELPDRSLPLLAPMSEVAGRLAPQVGAATLMRAQGGRGILMGGVSGVYAAKVVVIGAGVSGMNAAAIALGMQAEVLLLDRNVARLRQADAIYQGHCQTVASNSYEVERAIMDADMVIGAVLVPGAKAPTLVTNEQVSRMKPGSVLVDISIDQGGCFEDSRPTTHADPTYPVHNSVFYCVANMPGAVPHTSTYALTNVTLPYAVELANRGWRDALRADTALALGLNTHDGRVTYGPVAEAHGMPARAAGRGPVLSAAAAPAAPTAPLERAVHGWLDHLRSSAASPTTPFVLPARPRALRGVPRRPRDRPTPRPSASRTSPLPGRPARGGRDASAAVGLVGRAHPGRGPRVPPVPGARGRDRHRPRRRRPPARPPQRLPKAISVPDVERLLSAASVGDTPASLRDRALLEVLYGAGARISEAVGLDVDDVELEDGRGGLLRLLGKGSKERVVPLGQLRPGGRRGVPGARPAHLRRRRRRRTPALFLNQRGGRLSRQSAWSAIGAAAARAGLERAGQPAHAAPLLRHAPARRRRGRPRGAGAARARLGHDHPDLHAWSPCSGCARSTPSPTPGPADTPAGGPCLEAVRAPRLGSTRSARG